MKKKAIDKKMTPLQVIKFIDDVQQMKKLTSSKSKLVSIKIPEGLLRVFRTKCELENIPYQSQIKILMEEWLKK
jgi:predicted DNA binding CopG/RHH family protein